MDMPLLYYNPLFPETLLPRVEQVSLTVDEPERSLVEFTPRPKLYDQAWETPYFEERVQLLKDMVETEGYQR